MLSGKLSAEWHQAEGDEQRVKSENFAKSQSICTARARKKLSAWEFYAPYRISLVIHRIRGTVPDYDAHILRCKAKNARADRWSSRFSSRLHYIAAYLLRKQAKLQLR